MSAIGTSNGLARAIHIIGPIAAMHVKINKARRNKSLAAVAGINCRYTPIAHRDASRHHAIRQNQLAAESHVLVENLIGPEFDA